MEYKFNENTRVQVPAALHLCRLGYTYLDNITEYDSKTNILTDVFLRSVQRLNPELSDLQAKQLLSEIILILNNNDLGREYFPTIRNMTMKVEFRFKVHFIAVHPKAKLSSMSSVRLIKVLSQSILIRLYLIVRRDRYCNTEIV